MCVGGWVSEFETNGIVYMLIHTISKRMVCLDQFGLGECVLVRPF